MGEVDPAFIQEPEHRPKLSATEADGSIPLIDLSLVSSADYSSISNRPDPRAIEGLVREIGSACSEWGFFQVINHGVSSETRRKPESAARKFFAQPLEGKRKVIRNEESLFGFFDGEHTKNVRDWKEVFDVAVSGSILAPVSPDSDDDRLLNGAIGGLSTLLS